MGPVAVTWIVLPANFTPESVELPLIEQDRLFPHPMEGEAKTLNIIVAV